MSKITIDYAPVRYVGMFSLKLPTNPEPVRLLTFFKIYEDNK